MANDIRINIVTDYNQSVTALNKVTAGVDAARKSVIAAKEGTEEYSQSLETFFKAIERESAQLNKHGQTIDSLRKTKELLARNMNYMKTAFGEENAAVQELTKAYDYYNGEIAKYEQRKAAEAKAARESTAAHNEQYQAIQFLIRATEEMVAVQQQVNSKNANLGLMVLNGDEIGVARYALEEYEAVLKQTIADTGINSKETQAAYAVYKNQVDIVKELTENERLHNESLQEQEQILKAINNRYESYEANRYKTGKIDSGIGGSSFDTNNLAFYNEIGDKVGYAREELKLYEQQLRHVLASENASRTSVLSATESYKKQKDVVEKLEKQFNKSTTGIKKFASIYLNILKFQLVLKTLNSIPKTLRECSKAAAEAEQVFNKLNTVFVGVEKSAQSMASSLASSIGVANSTAASALSTVGDLLQAQGMGTSQSLSTAASWVKQFQDIIAFKDINMSLEEFAQNFMSGAAGNLRNFRTFGSIVKETNVQARLASQGLDKLTGSELELAKMTARAEIALEQQKNSIGATEREWETNLSINRRLNEAWKEYKESIGESLNEAIKPAKSWLADILDLTNNVTRALKEIDGGEFTVKVEQGTTTDFLKEIMGVMAGVSSTDSNGNVGNWWKRLLLDMLPSIMAQSGSTKQSVVAAQQVVNSRKFTDSQVANMMLALGASPEQMMDAASQGGYTITDEVMQSAIAIVEKEKEAIKLQERLNSEWEKSTSSAESLLSSISSVYTSANFNDYDEMINAISGNTPGSESGLSGMQSTLDTYLKNALSSMLGGFGATSLETFKNPIDIAFGTDSDEDALKSKIESTRKLYEIIYNYGVKTGENVQDYLDKLLGYYEESNKALDEIVAEAERKAKYDNSLSTSKGNTTDFRKQESQLRMTDDEKALDDIFRVYKEAMALEGLDATQKAELVKAYREEWEALKSLQEAQAEYNAELEKEEQLKSINEKTADYRKQYNQLGMTDAEKVIDDLMSELTGDGQLDAAIKEQIAAFELLTKATEEREEAERMAAAWQNLGQQALGSMGTVGSAISTFSDGEGDIYTDILTVLLDIFQQAEAWNEVVEIVNQVIQPLLPLVDMIAYTLTSLKPVFEIVTFVIKVISSILAVTLGAVNKVIDIVEWLWDNMKIAFKNVAIDIYNLFHWKNKKDREEGTALQDYWAETDAKTNEILENIWHGVTDDNGDFKTLEDLLARDIINLDQYNAGLRVKQKDMVFDPVTPAQYVGSGTTTSSTVKHNNFTITLNGNVEENRRMLIRLLREADIEVPGMALGV